MGINEILAMTPLQVERLTPDVVKVLLALATDTRIRKWVPAAPVIEELRKRGLTNEPQQ